LNVSNQEPVADPIGPCPRSRILFVAFLVFVVLYFARVVVEPIAFVFFGMALVWPFQKALEARLPRSVALGLTISLALLVILALAAAIVWSIDDVVHWTVTNLPRFQSLYARWTQWLELYDIHPTAGLGQYDYRTFIDLLGSVAAGAKYFVGFCIVVFLLMTFGLTEIDGFRARLHSLAPDIGRDVCRTTADIAGKIRNTW